MWKRLGFTRNNEALLHVSHVQCRCNSFLTPLQRQNRNRKGEWGQKKHRFKRLRIHKSALHLNVTRCSTGILLKHGIKMLLNVMAIIIKQMLLCTFAMDFLIHLPTATHFDCPLCWRTMDCFPSAVCIVHREFWDSCRSWDSLWN